MGSAQNIVRTWRTGPVGNIALARSDSLNAFDLRLAGQLRAAIATTASDPGVRCMLLSGDGPSFSVGGDLRVLRTQTAEETVALNDEVLAVADLLEQVRVPSVASLHGHVFGAGLEVALACSLRVAATDARLGLPEVRLGLIPASGGLVRLAEQVGAAAALRLLLTGDTVDGEEAHRLGLVQFTADPCESSDLARGLAERIAANAPLAVRAIVGLMGEQTRCRRGRALERTAARLPELLDSEDLREGLASFADKKPARFTGR